jgi:ABC-type bacteriocin/lantibiotic exporter with double-glycine peptidase domain
MAPSLEKIKADLLRFDTERKFWLLVSGFVATAIIMIIYKWNDILSNHLVWIIVSSMLTVSVIWWYWTMRVVRSVLRHRHSEVEILHDLINDIKEIKTEVSKLRE